jgi:hypothetical protein
LKRDGSYRRQRDKVEVKDEDQVNETTAPVNKTLLFLALLVSLVALNLSFAALLLACHFLN